LAQSDFPHLPTTLTILRTIFPSFHSFRVSSASTCALSTMPFDPLSLVGILSTTAGLLSFLASTVENINVRYHNYRECTPRLKEYKHIVESIFLDLQEWSWLWSQRRGGNFEPYEDMSYTLFWGQSGLRGITARSESIKVEVKAIMDILACRNIEIAQLGLDTRLPTTHDIFQWELTLDKHTEHPPSSREKSESWTYRIAFAIYRNTALKNRIETLQRLVSELRKTSTSLYRMNHEARMTTSPDLSRLQQTAALHEERNQLLRFLDELYQDNNESSLRWDLVLGNPSLRVALSRLRRESSIQMEFIFKGHSATGIEDRKIVYPMFRNMQRSEILGRASGMLADNSTESPGSSAMDRPPLISEQLRLRVLGLLDLENKKAYALTAVTAARSTILLYKSAWVHGLCFCGITSYHFLEKDKIMAYFPNANCSHVDHQLRNNVFLLLAILLAELAVGAPIQAYLTDSSSADADPEFLLHGYSYRMSWDTLSELLSERIYEVPESFVSVEFLEAMQCCYSLSQKLTKRDFVDDDLNNCITQIETP
jgi:hypothetical protein